MATEIERKYLVKSEPWRDAAAKGFEVRQGYLCMDREKVVRVRTTGGRGFLCVKGEGKGITRPEFEYEIPLSDAEEVLETLCIGSVIEKTRHLVEHEGLTWEVDEFLGENLGLVVAEVELESEDQVFKKPEWLGEEVSGDPRYLNANLSRHPFREWEGSRTEDRGTRREARGTRFEERGVKEQEKEGGKRSEDRGPRSEERGSKGLETEAGKQERGSGDEEQGR